MTGHEPWLIVLRSGGLARSITTRRVTRVEVLVAGYRYEDMASDEARVAWFAAAMDNRGVSISRR